MFTAAATSGTRPPGRPRSPEADEAILRATLDLLTEVGYRSLSMEQVRVRAGVGKATIYRRHSGKDDLVKAAIRHLSQDLPVPEDTGSLVGDLGALADSGVLAARATRTDRILPQLLAEVGHDTALQSMFHECLVEPRRRVLRVIFERAIDRGEVRSDVDLEIVMDLIVGAIVYRGLISGMEPEVLRERFAAGVATVLRGLRPDGS